MRGAKRERPDRAAGGRGADPGDAVEGAILHQIGRRLPFLRVPIELDVGHRRRGRNVLEMARMLGQEQLQPHVAIGDHPAIAVMRMAHRLLDALGDGLVAQLGLQHLLFVVASGNNP